jgi:hypothetical protein
VSLEQQTGAKCLMRWRRELRNQRHKSFAVPPQLAQTCSIFWLGEWHGDLLIGPPGGKGTLNGSQDLNPASRRICQLWGHISETFIGIVEASDCRFTSQHQVAAGWQFFFFEQLQHGFVVTELPVSEAETGFRDGTGKEELRASS